MKFAEKLKHMKVKSWEHKYIDYKFLKKIIKRKCNPDIISLYERIDKNNPDVKEVCSLINSEYKYPSNHKEKKKKSDIECVDIDYDYLFFYILEEYINMVKEHYVNECSFLTEKLNEIKYFLESDKINLKEIEMLKTKCLHIYNSFDILNNYLNINVLSVYKILKKKNKKEKLTTSLDLYQKYCNNLHQISKEEQLNEKIKSTYLLVQKKRGDNCEKLDFLNFKIYIKSKIEKIGQYKGTLYILCGILITLIINTIILLYININNINMNVILSVLPVYRLLYVLNFFFLFIFGSFLFMQFYGVNFTYILDLNKIIIDEYYYLINYVILIIFLTTLSLLIFLLDVLFQIHIFSNIVFHVFVLFILLFCTTIFPFNFYKYKENNFVFSSLLRVLLSGLFLVNNVNLLDNIIGDILTSLSKTFSDVQYLLCFLLKGMKTKEPAKCPILETYINPIFLALPFYLRLCQCLIRFNNEREKVHIYNMLKYLSGIFIVICTSFNWSYFGFDIYTSKLILVCSYVIGSTYMYIWDLYCDWGLLKEYNHLLRKNNNIMYPPHYYYFAGLLNLIFRLTWAITIMPINIFENKEINSFLITFFLMFIEVLRRSIWMCFRLENEHVTNASRYRAILWVPRLTKKKKF
ncbi:G-protein associated signal transduction protein, putative [Plasmodium sp. gorilla clade G2]|uniref:G-protein associated signal transduction protein, putative n=1 Tax=Plasmodium sp. gorilla clade G2 TaxID=880535 RepID=UPI000D21F8A5|nr:G-protein associated signal transduction protein, putative [Plasmodium sp. gorilla clade G2]SOV12412.1 G-protein associated signal transduction protein, putative [Plasmodium sp. gorilla clade G2]